MVTREVIYKEFQDVADFCCFETFLGSDRGLGLLRFMCGRDSNDDMMAVGIPLIFQFSTSRQSNMVKFNISLGTVHFNGAYGTPTFPHLVTGLLKEEKHRNNMVTHVRDILPHSHPLYAKGWTTLARDRHSLADAAAVPA